MKYRNTKTGALIETACPVSGGDWVKVKESTAGAAGGMPSTTPKNKAKSSKECPPL